jgi:hypothetical protein
VQYKCREKINGKECNGSFTLNNYDNSFTLKSHKHSHMFPIECEIKKIRLEIDKLILENPSRSISKIWDKKLIELTLKYSEREVAMCTIFSSLKLILKNHTRSRVRFYFA